jgi:hypothetical protein
LVYCWVGIIQTIAKREKSAMRKSRSSDEIDKLSSELSWSEKGINSSFVVVGRGGISNSGDRNTNTSRTRRRNSTIERNKSVLLNSFNNNNGSSIFRKSSSLASSIKFPINAFTVENSAEFYNPTLFAEVYSMAFISACKLLNYLHISRYDFFAQIFTVFNIATRLLFDSVHSQIKYQ